MFVHVKINNMSIVLLVVVTFNCVGKGQSDKGNRIVADYSASKDLIFEVPTNLPRDIEVLILSFNGIRELKSNSFLKYAQLRILSLRRNALHNIEYGAFGPLSNLRTLDLALNVLQEIPPYLPQSLVKLDLEGNPTINVFKNATSCITNFADAIYLETLSLRSNSLVKFPEFCTHMPMLSELDVSGNSFHFLSPTNLAPLCGLRKLNIDVQVYGEKELFCECKKFEKWARNRGITLSNEICNKTDFSDTKCNDDPTYSTIAFYEECLKQKENIKNSYLQLIIGIFAIAAIFCILLVICGVRLWRRKHQKLLIKCIERNEPVVIFQNQDENGS